MVQQNHMYTRKKQGGRLSIHKPVWANFNAEKPRLLTLKHAWGLLDPRRDMIIHISAVDMSIPIIMSTLCISSNFHSLHIFGGGGGNVWVE